MTDTTQRLATAGTASLGATDLALYAVTVFVWGTSWIALRMQLGVVAPEVSLVWRFAIAVVIMFAWVGVRNGRLAFPLADHLRFAGLGALIFSTNFVLFYYGGLTVPSGLLAVVFSLASVVNLFLGVVFLGQRLDGRIVLGGVAGALGVGAMFAPQILGTGFDHAGLVGLGLCVLGTLSFCLGNMVAAASQRRGVPVLSANAWGMAYGVLFLALLSLVRGHAFIVEPTVVYLGSLVWLAVTASVIAFACYLTLLSRIGAARAGYTTVLFPVVALALSTVFEGYRWTPLAVAGLVLVLAGNVLVLRRPRSPG